ncbi:replication initiator [Actinomadura parmotrematis]|uniref:Replication initiation protein n=1 Tax=Actinomadura parmotrematis TaxID=2864039 RepID=A0ABS7FWQ2_9ACTN|nr:replication initiator [Actinomadura parmotrematis]MBW8484104.1 replication initiation protein [Actinomadura parmotrematis]
MIVAALARAGADYFGWLDHVWSAAGCTHPIRLFGEITRINARTGEVLGSTPTTALPDGVIYKACGNRRSAVCPSCAETYRRDAFQLIRSGLIGGKTVPAHVARHPAVFATFTAPSFGPVHTRHIRTHTCTDRRRCSCRPEPCRARRSASAGTCPHGNTLTCFARHEREAEQLGQPLCSDCYDHAAHVVWNNQAGELWRRTKQAIERHLNRSARSRDLAPVRVSHGKVAEFQARGAVHFHILLRVDGIDPGDPAALIVPPTGITAADIDQAVHQAAENIGFLTDHHPDRPSGWPIYWGEQTDVRVITMTGADPLTDAMVAGYLAKYATKSTEITGHTSRRLDAATIGLYADPTGTHTERLIAAAWQLGEVPGWEGLRRWAHMLGFGGHFLTKARRYSVTFQVLRDARIIHRRTQTPSPEVEAIRCKDGLTMKPRSSSAG